MGNPSQRVWRFDEFQFREATGELLHRGEPFDLRPQAAKLLELLLADAGQVVTREEIQQHLWPDTVVDFEQGLNTAVRQLRRTLEEEAASPRYVQTVPRRGYRWIGPAECLHSGTTDGGRSRSAAWSLSRRPLAWAAAAVLLAACGLAAVSWIGMDGPVWGDQPRERRLLVLPLQTLGWNGCPDSSGDDLPGPRQYLADALTEELISQAAALAPSGIKILGRASTRRFGEAVEQADPSSMPGDSLGKGWNSPRFAQLQEAVRADYLLKGTLRCSHGEVRVSLRLIDARDGSNVWGESYDRPLDGLSNVHRKSVNALAEALSVGPAGADSVRDAPSPSQAVLKAEYLLRKRGTSARERMRDDRLAHDLLLEAVEADPGDARAHLALASTYLRIEPDNLAELLPLAREHVDEAIRLSPDMAEAHAAKAAIETFMLWNLESAQESFRRSLQLNPQRAKTHYVYAYYWLYQGRRQKAVLHMHRALDIDPVSTAVRGDLGWVYFSMRRYREAIEESRRTLELEPEATHALMCLLWAHHFLGQEEEAAQAAIGIAERLPGQPQLAEVLKGLPPEEALTHYFRARDQYLQAHSGSQPVHPSTFAFLRAGVGDAEGALQALEAAYQRQHCHFLPLLEYDPRFDFLRGDPRYQDLVERIRRDTRLPQSGQETMR